MTPIDILAALGPATVGSVVAAAFVYVPVLVFFVDRVLRRRGR